MRSDEARRGIIDASCAHGTENTAWTTLDKALHTHGRETLHAIDDAHCFAWWGKGDGPHSQLPMTVGDDDEENDLAHDRLDARLQRLRDELAKDPSEPRYIDYVRTRHRAGAATRTSPPRCSTLMSPTLPTSPMPPTLPTSHILPNFQLFFRKFLVTPIFDKTLTPHLVTKMTSPEPGTIANRLRSL